MGLRSLKRKFERENRHRSMAELYAHVDRVNEKQKKELWEEYKELSKDEDAKAMSIAMYYLFGLNLHRLFGFGQQRLLRLFAAVDEELGTWNRGEVEVEDLHQRLVNELGIDVQINHREDR